MGEGKERRKEEAITFDEERKNFEMERRSFTEAAIRLGHEVISRVTLLLECNCHAFLINFGWRDGSSLALV